MITKTDTRTLRRSESETLQKFYVAGHLGMVGSAIVRKLEELASCSIVTRTRDQLDLTNQSAVQNFFADEKPDVTIIAAAKVGGILANNKFPAEFIYQNLLISSNLVHQSFVSKAIFFAIILRAIISNL